VKALRNAFRALFGRSGSGAAPGADQDSDGPQPLRLSFPEDVANVPWTRANAAVVNAFLNGPSGSQLFRILTATVVSRSLASSERSPFEQGKTVGMALMLRELWEAGRIDRERWEGADDEDFRDS